jgi:hypothetical protein
MNTGLRLASPAHVHGFRAHDLRPRPGMTPRHSPQPQAVAVAQEPGNRTGV